MGLNVVKGNMYDWVSHTWNTVKGECPHGCHYCYMKRWGKQKQVRFDESELNTDLGDKNFIFVGSSCDMWADSIPYQWINKTIDKCKQHTGNTYFFQTKNPRRLWYPFSDDIPEMSVVCTTIETNRQYDEMGDTPHPVDRAHYLSMLEFKYRAMVTIEPVMDFDVDEMVSLIECCSPDQVNIGANTNRKIKLPEPNAEKVKDLVYAIAPITTVKIKPNLKRITG